LSTLRAGTGGPAPAILEIDGYAWKRASGPDAVAMEAVAAIGFNRLIFNLPASEDEFSKAVEGGSLRRPMVCRRDNQVIGAAAVTTRNQRSLNLQLVCWFVTPAHATLPLAVYLRHIFWSQVIHRVYAQFPVIDGSEQYAQLLLSVGFREEGVVRGHVLIDQRPHDLRGMAILRAEFDAWCLQEEPRLSL